MGNLRRTNKPQNWWGKGRIDDLVINQDTIDDTLLASSDKPTTHNVRTNAEEVWPNR